MVNKHETLSSQEILLSSYNEISVLIENYKKKSTKKNLDQLDEKVRNIVQVLSFVYSFDSLRTQKISDIINVIKKNYEGKLIDIEYIDDIVFPFIQDIYDEIK